MNENPSSYFLGGLEQTPYSYHDFLFVLYLAFKFQISRIADWGMFYTADAIPDYGSLAKPICLGKDINMEIQIANIAGWGATQQGIRITRHANISSYYRLLIFNIQYFAL